MLQDFSFLYMCLSFFILSSPLSIQPLSCAGQSSLAWKKRMWGVRMPPGIRTQNEEISRSLRPRKAGERNGIASEPASSSDTGRHFWVDSDKDQH